MRRLLVLAALGLWAAVTIAAAVLAVLWLRDGDDREISEQVRGSRAIWDDHLAELRAFEDEVGPVWTTDALRPRVYDDVALSKRADSFDAEPYLYTVRDAERSTCADGVHKTGRQAVLQVCRATGRGEMTAAHPFPAEQTDDRATIVVTEWRTMPGATDARVLVDIDLPAVTDPGEAALRAQLAEAMDRAEDLFEGLEVQRIDLDSPAWTDYDFLFDSGLWEAEPAPVKD